MTVLTTPVAAELHCAAVAATAHVPEVSVQSGAGVGVGAGVGEIPFLLSTIPYSRQMSSIRTIMTFIHTRLNINKYYYIIEMVGTFIPQAAVSSLFWHVPFLHPSQLQAFVHVLPSLRQRQ